MSTTEKTNREREMYLKLAAACLAILAFLTVLAWAGDIDYTEQIILGMTQEQYDSVRRTLTELNHGHEPSERDIAHWWAEHRDDYP